jgi:hypothetical protein
MTSYFQSEIDWNGKLHISATLLLEKKIPHKQGVGSSAYHTSLKNEVAKLRMPPPVGNLNTLLAASHCTDRAIPPHVEFIIVIIAFFVVVESPFTITYKSEYYAAPE